MAKVNVQPGGFLRHVELAFLQELPDFFPSVFCKEFQVFCLCGVDGSFVQYYGIFAEVCVELGIFLKEACGNFSALTYKVFPVFCKLLVFADAISPRLGDWMVRAFKLDGVQTGDPIV